MLIKPHFYSGMVHKNNGIIYMFFSDSESVIRMIDKTLRSIFLAGIILNVTNAYADDEEITEIGDILQFALPLSAYAGTAIAKDKEGAIMYSKSLLTTVTVTWAGKQISEKFRPKGTSNQSFPSGHSSAAFSGASFLYTRYGKAYGIPAYALAAFTAYSRVNAEAHHIDDVIAGASIGMFSNWYFVSPHESRVTVYPSVYNDNYYLNLNINGDGKRSVDLSERGKYRYALYFGPADQRNNVFRSPNNSSGTEFNLVTFSERNDPTTTANLVFSAQLDDRSELMFSIEPFEARDIGQFSSDVNFAGDTFPANTDVQSRYRLIDARLQYQYDLLESYTWDFKLGGSISAQRTVLELSTTEGIPSSYGKVDDWVFLPLLHVEGVYHIDRSMALIAEGSWMETSDDRHLDGSLMFNYQFDRHWDAGIGYGEYHRRTDTSELLNDVSYNIVLLNVGYTF
jgi:hypothetical protein